MVLLLPEKPGGQSQWKRSACPTNEVQVPPWAQVFGLQVGSESLERWLHCCPDQPGSHSQKYPPAAYKWENNFGDTIKKCSDF